MRCICVNSLYLCLVPVAHLGGGATRIDHSQREEDRGDQTSLAEIQVCASMPY